MRGSLFGTELFLDDSRHLQMIQGVVEALDDLAKAGHALDDQPARRNLS